MKERIARDIEFERAVAEVRAEREYREEQAEKEKKDEAYKETKMRFCHCPTCVMQFNCDSLGNRQGV